MPTMKAKQGNSTAYYFSKDGVIKATAYSQWLFWGIWFVVFVFFLLFIIGGAIGGIIVGAIVSVGLDYAISGPKIRKWDGMSFKELAKEKESEQISWSSISKAVFKNPDGLELYVGDKRQKLKIVSRGDEMRVLLKGQLGKKLMAG